MSIIILGVEILYILVFFYVFHFFDKVLRSQGKQYRKQTEITLCIFHTICWIILSFFLQDYIIYIVPAAVTLLLFPLMMICEKERRDDIK